MNEENNPWKLRFERERRARKESESLLEEKSLELWKNNQELEKEVNERTESLKKALNKAERADRAKSDFLANMSHEIRTPLNAIIGFSEFLSHSSELSDENVKYASIIESSATSLLSIINDILDFSKIESGNFDISIDDYNLISICEQVIELFSQKANEKNINLVLDMKGDIPSFVKTDGLRMRQVFSNLLSNALKFTPEYGTVTLCVNASQKNTEKVMFNFEVKDTGIGIPSDKIDSILNPFVQLEHISNKQNVGTGLGLSICYNILKLFNAKLKVKSEVGEGSSFYFNVDMDIGSGIEEKIPYVDEKKSFEGTVLLAEDNLANQELMKLILTNIGIDFDIVSNGREVIKAYQEKDFDIILMDINMPEINGVEAFHYIREYENVRELPNTPIIALTANAIKGDKEKFLNLGMDGYLSKPIDVHKLNHVLSKFLRIKEIKIVEKEINLISVNNQVFDLEKICKNLGVSENIALLVIKKFKVDILKDLDEFDSIIQQKDYLKIKDKAHYIKNSCLNVALDDVCGLLEYLESNTLSESDIRKTYDLIRKNIEPLLLKD